MTIIETKYVKIKDFWNHHYFKSVKSIYLILTKNDSQWFSCWIWGQNLAWSIFRVSLKLKWKRWFLGNVYISGGIIRKKILHSDYHSSRWSWWKKTRKTFHKLHIKFFSMLHCEFFVVMSIYGSKYLQKSIFMG